VFLLHTAAEIEHVLMVQYLYAAYSLADGDFAGSTVPPDAAARTARWRNTIASIAREEMAHLLTEQNLLRFIGGPLNLEREDFPFRSALYPFPLSLEPMSRTSLAKYVAAEMPAAPAVPDIGEIVDRATSATGGFRPNRVGVLFDTLVDIFADPAKLRDDDLHPETAPDRQAQAFDWFGFGRLIVRTAASRTEAVAALRAIGEQGEGPDNTPPGAPLSHFDEFLAIYREFPETTGGALDWTPTRSIPTDPTTAVDVQANPAVERNRITDPRTRLWAQLFDVRYRMLLAEITHALHLTGPLTDDAGNSTPRGHLRDWAFQQMRGEGLSGLRGIARLLTTRPAKQTPAPGDPANAAAPFQVPYTLVLPDDEHSRWRLHLALLETSADLMTRLTTAGETDSLLTELASIDAAASAVVKAQLAGI
jgi:YD repeat-containing protein